MNHIGKTAIIDQYIRQILSEEPIPTIGCDKYIKEININGNRLNVEIWDSCGDEQYRAGNQIFMQNKDIALLIYDITDRRSFEKLNYWKQTVKKINKINNKEVLFGVIGNKNDLDEEREIDEEEGKKFAKDNNALFFEISAKDYENVENVF